MIGIYNYSYTMNLQKFKYSFTVNLFELTNKIKEPKNNK